MNNVLHPFSFGFGYGSQMRQQTHEPPKLKEPEKQQVGKLTEREKWLICEECLAQLKKDLEKS